MRSLCQWEVREEVLLSPARGRIRQAHRASKGAGRRRGPLLSAWRKRDDEGDMKEPSLCELRIAQELQSQEHESRPGQGQLAWGLVWVSPLVLGGAQL